VAGVLVALALSVAMLVMVSSFRDSLQQWLRQVLPADLYVRSALREPDGQSSPLPAALLAPAMDAILFDMDGVLIEAKEWHFEALNRALDLFGMAISRVDHLSTFDGLPTRKKFPQASRLVSTKMHPMLATFFACTGTTTWRATVLMCRTMWCCHKPSPA
jgi:hypothetical protein